MSDVDRLEVQIQANANKANTQLDLLSDKLKKVGSSLSGVQSGGLLQLSNGVNHLSSAMKNLSGVRATDYTKLATGIQKLSSMDSASIYRASNAIRNISSSLSGMAASAPQGATAIADLATAISKLGYKTSTTAITNIPKLATAIRELLNTLSTAPEVSRNIIDLANALANLASQGQKVSTAGKAVTNVGKSAQKSLLGYGKGADYATRTSISLRNQIMKVVSAFYLLKRAATTVWSSVQKAMDYGETVNLFQTAFKKIGMEAAEEAGYDIGTAAAEGFAKGFLNDAQYFADYISDALSLDPNTVMNYQAIFGQISNAMGNTSDTAMALSQSFTMLGVDMASLFNDDISIAMEKLQSGLTGQVKPLREYGIDITEATLQTYAYKYGIEESVSAMSQAEKVQLRSLAIMDQSSIAFGDMGKTLDSSANSFRVLQQQWSNFTRSIGNVFLPMVQTVLPYLNGFLIAIRNITDAFATATGYKTPDYSDTNTNAYSDVVNGLLDVDETATDAEESVDKLNKSLAKFDDLNDIGRQASSDTSGTTTGTGATGGGYSQLDDAIQNANNNYMAKFREEIEKTGNKAKEIAEKIQPKIQGVIDLLDKFEPAFKGIAAAFATYKIIDLFHGLGTKLLALGGTTTGKIALVVGGLIALGGAIKNCYDKAKKNDLAERFGEIKLSLEELEKIATEIADNGTLDNLGIFEGENDKLSGIKNEIDEAAQTIQKYNWKVSIGLELTESEQEEYKTAINTYVSKCSDYITQENIAVTMAIDLLMDDGEDQDAVINKVNQFYAGKQAELEAEAKKLQDTINDAFFDGFLDPDETKEVQDILTSIENINNTLATANMVAELENIKVKYGSFSGADLDPDTFKQLMKDMQDVTNKASEQYDEALQIAIANANIMLNEGDIDRTEYEKMIAEYKQEYLENIGEINARVTKFELQSVYDAFGKELETRLPDFQESLQKNVDKWFKGIEDGEVNTDLTKLFELIRDDVQVGYQGLSTTAKSNLNDLIELMKPNTEQLEKVAKSAAEAGDIVPSSIANALAASYYLEAISGNTDALYKLICTSVSDSEERKALIIEASGSGSEIGEEILNGLNLSKADLTAGIESLLDGVGIDIGEFTKQILPDVTKNGKKIDKRYAKGIGSEKEAELAAKHMVEEAEKAAAAEKYYEQFNKDGQKVGTNYSDGIKNKTSEATGAARTLVDSTYNEVNKDTHYDKVRASGERFGQSFIDGITNKELAAELAATHLVEEAQKKAEYEAYINGRDVSNGYANGVRNGTANVSNAMTDLSNTANSTFQNNMDIHSPSKLYEKFAKYTVDGYDNGIINNMGRTKSAIARWADLVENEGSRINVQGNYSINTSGIEGYSNLFQDSTVTMRAVQSLNIDQTSNSLSNLPSMVYKAVYEAITRADITAVMDSDSAFSTMQRKSTEYTRRTHRPAFS